MRYYKLTCQTGETFKNKQWVITVSDDPHRTGRAFCVVPQWVDMSPEQARTDADHILAVLRAVEEDIQTARNMLRICWPSKDEYESATQLALAWDQFASQVQRMRRPEGVTMDIIDEVRRLLGMKNEGE